MTECMLMIFKRLTKQQHGLHQDSDFGNSTVYVTSLEYLVREPLGAAALEASYYKGPEHVEEASECLCHLTDLEVLGFRV